jgi:8-oxo-dGTP pyrophosphatase MutT (NUDIX family)
MMDLAAINEIAHTLTHPNTRPRNAATLILVDRSGREPKVLLGKRHVSHAFMPGRFVFPGGRIEPADRDAPAAAELRPGVEARLNREVARPSAKAARAFGLAAIRETFEETGIVIGRRHAGPAPPARGPWAGFLGTGFAPDLSELRFVARAITPPRAKRRFDARFLAVDASAIAHHAANIVHAGAELTEIVWVGIADAMKLPLPDITEIVLADVARCVAAGFVQDAPVPFYRMQHSRFTRGLL